MTDEQETVTEGGATMTNAEKYKTAKERADAFIEWCKAQKNCDNCEVKNLSISMSDCAFAWLDLEAPAEKPLPCPFCGHEVKVGEIDNEKKEAVEFYIHCDGCHVTTMDFATREELLSMWNNRVARAVAKEKENNND